MLKVADYTETPFPGHTEKGARARGMQTPDPHFRVCFPGTAIAQLPVFAPYQSDSEPAVRQRARPEGQT